MMPLKTFNMRLACYTFAITFIVSLVVACVGCTHSTATNPEKKHLAGMHGRLITVHVEGCETQRVPGSNMQILQNNHTCKGQFSLYVLADQKMGLPVKEIDLTIHPSKDGQPDWQSIYRPKAVIESGKEIFISSFECLDQTGYKTCQLLPAGEYFIKIQIVGQRLWDSQLIAFTVKTADK